MELSSRYHYHIVLTSVQSRIFPHPEHRFELTDLDRERLGDVIPVLNKHAQPSLFQILVPSSFRNRCGTFMVFKCYRTFAKVSLCALYARNQDLNCPSTSPSNAKRRYRSFGCDTESLSFGRLAVQWPFLDDIVHCHILLVAPPCKMAIKTAVK